MLKKAVQQGRSERRAEAYPLGYVEGLSDARTKLADFFSILLVGGEVRMKSGWMAAVVMIGAVSIVGCVSQKKYEEAIVGVESANLELERTRTQKNALEQQVKTLKDLNVKFGYEAQVAHDELERIQHGRDKERGSVEGRTKELEDRVKQLSFQNRAVRHEYEDVKRHNETLKSLVARYQKELKDQSRPVTGIVTPAAPSLSSAPSGMPASPAMTAPQPVSSSMNVNKASAGDLVLVLGLSKEVADRIVTNRPYRLKGELVAKNVVPKETFDLIKERISVSP
jgi:DNA uptake protein ComE-like DNA-binding protein/outer membrane murein-binding lipoprotein Lpp